MSQPCHYALTVFLVQSLYWRDRVLSDSQDREELRGWHTVGETGASVRFIPDKMFHQLGNTGSLAVRHLVCEGCKEYWDDECLHAGRKGWSLQNFCVLHEYCLSKHMKSNPLWDKIIGLYSFFFNVIWHLFRFPLERILSLHYILLTY